MLVNQVNARIIAHEVHRAATFWSRFRGLMFSPALPPDRALHIQPCQSIHTFFMRYSIDVLYLDEHQRVIGVEQGLAPGKMGRRFRKTKSIVELPAGKINEMEIVVGQEVLFIPKNNNDQGVYE